jgi:hypothetical protein
MQFTLTNDFTTAERALLHATLLHIKEQNATQRAIEKMNNIKVAKIFHEFASFTDTTMDQLIEKLFHDCFLEDMDFIKEFAKQRNSALASNTVLVNGD